MKKSKRRKRISFKDFRRDIFIEEELDDFEEAPERILDTAAAKYAAESLEFQQELEYFERDTLAFSNTFGIVWDLPEPVSDA